jgi:endoglycosylceramidase
MHRLLAVALLALCLVGCDAGDPDPTPVSGASPSRSPSVSATATVPASRTPAPSDTATATATAAPTETPTSRPPATLEPLEIHADESWIRDAGGRVVILRGANYSGLEFGNFIGNPRGPDAADFAQMASWGFNVIRLPIAWSFVEAVPNQFDDTYLVEQVDRVVEFAATHGIAVILEMHQFQWSPCFTNGNGAPAWICEGRSYPDDISGAYQAECDFFTGALAPDGRPLMDHFVDLWRFVARHYAGDRRVAGIDFFNEPGAFACPDLTIDEFDREILNPLYRRLRAVVQEEGALQTFFFTPDIIRNVGLGTLLEPFGPNVVYAPHLYTQTGGDPLRKYNGNPIAIRNDYERAVEEAAVLGGPLFAAEFGGNTTVEGGFLEANESFLRDTLAEQDRRLVGGAVWAYFPSDNTFSVVDAEGEEKGQLVNILARPYARRIAGIPTGMRFDLTTKEFELTFRDDPDHDVPEPTEIFVPAGRHYPGGFTVEASAGVAWSFDADSGQLLFLRGPGAEHRIRISAQ